VRNFVDVSERDDAIWNVSGRLLGPLVWRWDWGLEIGRDAYGDGFEVGVRGMSM
jgi:hypothetical protein